jgi:hypothetical protein
MTSEKLALGIGYTFCACLFVFAIWYAVTAVTMLQNAGLLW